MKEKWIRIFLSFGFITGLEILRELLNMSYAHINFILIVMVWIDLMRGD